ncbi:MAG: AbrB/MazE/SpoVT family DNA-binding domain-containing protein [Thermoprotei archaeon]|nr:MAG: AbrB/MazE/SpoVT family DNA-binding domain-containing protein [Thermoprotei archaeon]
MNCLSVETKVGKKRVIVIPKKIADAIKLNEGQKVRIIADVDNDSIIIRPIRDAIWLALHGRKIGKIMPKEIEEESLREQEKISKH